MIYRLLPKIIGKIIVSIVKVDWLFKKIKISVAFVGVIVDHEKSNNYCINEYFLKIKIDNRFIIVLSI